MKRTLIAALRRHGRRPVARPVQRADHADLLFLGAVVTPADRLARRPVDPQRRKGDQRQGRVPQAAQAGCLPPRPSRLAARTGGEVDAAFGAPAYSPKRFAAYQFTELPFLGDKAEITSVALWRTHVKFFADKRYFAGVELVGLNTHGPGHLFTRGRAVLEPAEHEGAEDSYRRTDPAPRSSRPGAAWSSASPHPRSTSCCRRAWSTGSPSPGNRCPSFRITRLAHVRHHRPRRALQFELLPGLVQEEVGRPAQAGQGRDRAADRRAFRPLRRQGLGRP